MPFVGALDVVVERDGAEDERLRGDAPGAAGQRECAEGVGVEIVDNEGDKLNG